MLAYEAEAPIQPLKGEFDTLGVSDSRLLCQAVRLPWGTISIRNTGPSPARSASTERCLASAYLQ